MQAQEKPQIGQAALAARETRNRRVTCPRPIKAMFPASTAHCHVVVDKYMNEMSKTSLYWLIIKTTMAQIKPLNKVICFFRALKLTQSTITI